LVIGRGQVASRLRGHQAAEVLQLYNEYDPHPRGRSRERNACFGNRRRKVEVLPVCLAPVSTTTGRVFAERWQNG
jgi:hypothetical protein